VGDLEELIHHFAGSDWQLDPDVLPTLASYSWPGNIRQLQNAIDRAKILAEDDRIRVQNLPPEILNGLGHQVRRDTGDEADLFSYTKQHVMEMYQNHHSNKSETARALGISRRTLYRLLEKYGVIAACSH
jgi:transcriptional regulator of acetoin/glycerol metabolism